MSTEDQKEPDIKEEKKQSIILKLKNILEKIEADLLKAQIPTLYVKSRDKENLIFEDGVWTLSDKKYTKKTLKTKGGAKELLKIAHTIAYLLDQLEKNKTSTLRDFYYVALNWIDQAKFEKINESNLCLENLEILLENIREQFNIYPEAEGSIAGPIKVEYTTRNGSKRVVHCTEDVGSTGFLLPRSLDDLKILECDAKFILVTETGGMFSRLIEEDFDKKHQAILVLTKGQPSRMTRKFIKKLTDQYHLKTAIFTDGDPFGFAIARTIIEGAIKSSHLSKALCTPKAIHVGLLPSQIESYKLPTDTITRVEKEALDYMIDDYRTQKNLSFVEELKTMRSTGLKAEQQSLSFYGLSFVTEVYLPQVLKTYNFI